MNFIYLDHLQIFRVFKPLLKQIASLRHYFKFKR